VVSLPQITIDFLNANARANGARHPGPDDDLFELGALDSFALVDLVTMLEEHCKVTVPDADLDQANFQTIEMIEHYVDSRRS
jgi:acyl carrier protein